jgi:hypothetical protein
MPSPPHLEAKRRPAVAGGGVDRGCGGACSYFGDILFNQGEAKEEMESECVNAACGALLKGNRRTMRVFSEPKPEKKK